MNFADTAIVFDCLGEQLVGICSCPANQLTRNSASQNVGVVFVVGGPQYRVGSHRQFLLLAHSLADAGFPVLRFDVRGMGDSSGELHTFERISPDIGAAINALQTQVPSVRRVVLWGLCDGASASLLYCYASGDRRVAGLCLLNPWVRSEASMARTHIKYYYLQRLREKHFWAKLLSGKVAGKALSGFLRNIRLMTSSNSRTAKQAMSFQQIMSQAWARFEGRILLQLSGNDYTAKEFLEFAKADPGWGDLLTRPSVDRHDIADADHTLSDIGLQVKAARHTLDWLDKHFRC